VSNGSYCGLLVRWAEFETNTGYLFIVTGSGTHEILKRVAGSTTSLNTASAGEPQGSTYRFHVVDTGLTVYRDDVSTLTSSDAAITSGSGGIMGYAVSAQTNAAFENFSAGNFATASILRRRPIIVH
jgi:hypothetical protein